MKKLIKLIGEFASLQDTRSLYKNQLYFIIATNNQKLKWWAILECEYKCECRHHYQYGVPFRHSPWTNPGIQGLHILFPTPFSNLLSYYAFPHPTMSMTGLISVLWSPLFSPWWFSLIHPIPTVANPSPDFWPSKSYLPFKDIFNIQHLHAAS